MWWKINIFLIAALFLIIGCGMTNISPVILTVNPDSRYQTIEGWGANLEAPGIPVDEWLKEPTPENYDKLDVKDSVPDELKAKIMDNTVSELGLNRFRLEIGPQVEMRNDNDDPLKTDFKAFRFKWQDANIGKWLLPIKQRIERRGEKMVLYISYDLDSSLTPEWLLQPDEYAEMAVTTLKYFKETYNMEPDYWTVLNEPGNQRPGNPKLVAQLIARTGTRIREEGFKTRMSGPEVVTPRQITDYMKALNDTPGALAQIGQLTYHLYWDPMNIIHRNEIRNWGQKLGITTAQTEWLGGKGLNVAEVLYLDLVEANTSSWEQYGLCWTANRYNTAGGGDYFVLEPDYSAYYMNINAWYLRQFMKYIRPGDVRISISSTDPKIKPVAFTKPDGRQTVVVINSSRDAKDINIKDLSPGSYEVILTDSRNKGEVLPQKVVAASESLTFQMPARSVVTFYDTGGRAPKLQ